MTNPANPASVAAAAAPWSRCAYTSVLNRPAVITLRLIGFPWSGHECLRDVAGWQRRRTRRHVACDCTGWNRVNYGLLVPGRRNAHETTLRRALGNSAPCFATTAAEL